MLLSLFLTGVIIYPSNASDRKSDRKLDSSIDPTSWGRVSGQIYDTMSGLPIAGAKVSIYQAGSFASDGKTTGVTDAAGRYTCQALIGRASSNLDIGRALNSGIVGILLGGATNRTKRVDISRLGVKVQCNGYRTFEGVVLCNDVDAGHFSVVMDPILLASTGSPYFSMGAPGWGVVRFISLNSAPPIARGDQPIKVTVRIFSPPLRSQGDIKVVGAYELNHKVMQVSFHPGGKEADNVQIYTVEIHLPASKQSQAAVMQVSLEKSPYDIMQGNDHRDILLQSVNSDGEFALAQKRAQAWNMMQSGDNVEASALWKDICAQPNALPWDFERLADVSDILHDYDTKLASLAKLVSITPQKPEQNWYLAVSEYADALVKAGKADTVISECAPLVDKIREGERPGKVPSSLMVSIGRAWVQKGDLEKAKKVSIALLDWPDSELDPATDRFRDELRMAEVREQLTKQPDNPAVMAAYGRILLDMGRWEESAVELNLALQKTDPPPGVKRDIAYALANLQRMQHKPEVPKDLDQKLENARRQTLLSDKHGKLYKSKDFYAWHSYAMLLYLNASRQEKMGIPMASAAYEECMNALEDALRCSHTGADVNQGFYAPFLGFVTSQQTSIAGFAYRQAEVDYLIYQSMKILADNPNDFISNYNLGSALAELGYADLSLVPLRRALAINPDSIETQYAYASACILGGEKDIAIVQLNEALKKNPWHPFADITLAKIYAEDGDIVNASALLLDHAKYYGNTE
jgi:tetratricopeptide (TPR) repeat protein